METLPPPLIDDGLVAQVLVEYVGLRVGPVRYRPPSGRVYSFSANGSARVRFVLSQDAPYFDKNSEFRVHAASWHDPAEIERQTAAAAQERMRGELDELKAEARTRQSGRRAGRPPVRTRDNVLAWHLKEHCSWRLADVATQLKVTGDDPADAVSARLIRHKKQNPARLDPSVCPHCVAGECPALPG